MHRGVLPDGRANAPRLATPLLPTHSPYQTFAANIAGNHRSSATKPKRDWERMFGSPLRCCNLPEFPGDEKGMSCFIPIESNP